MSHRNFNDICFIFSTNICKVWCLDTHFIPNNSDNSRDQQYKGNRCLQNGFLRTRVYLSLKYKITVIFIDEMIYIYKYVQSET